ncbi:sulfate adenylyltransferase subunit 1 [Nesterenkonia populi]|uniref:sulfate adenylyltransferase subunit 1 n=1 Tax=Nesterenkonia populi TaxID=1591087 RepID=UPI0011BD5A0E|nr:GTP-binding protein [Nesterenkonia populi]
MTITAEAPEKSMRSSGTLFRLATAGSVDDGKSTLVGRLLHDAQAILTDQLAAVARTSAERGFGESFDEEGQPLDLALLTDGLRSEREQGITIDVAYRYFATDKRSFVLADCPGHVQYTRNTVTGTSTADAVVLLVDVRNGVVEQTRRHLAVATLLRVEHIIVAVNKIDALSYSEDAFRAVETEIRQVSRDLRAQNAGAERAQAEPIVVPVSALRGDNVVKVSENTPWYTGEALLPVLEQLPDADAEHRLEEPMRLPVQTVIRPQGGLAPEVDAEAFTDFRGYAGQVAAGRLSPGDTVRIQPGGHATEVTAVRRTGLQQDLVPGEAASAGESVVVELAGQYDVARGSVLTAEAAPAQELDELTVRLAWLNEKPLVPGDRVLFKHGTATVKALVTEVDSRLDLTTLSADNAEQLQLNDIGTATIKLAAALPVDDYVASKRTGASLLIDPADGNTLAAGLISLPEAAEGQDAGSDEDWLSS